MTTRRTLLAGAAGLGLLAACKPAASTGTPQKLLVRHESGLGVVTSSGDWLIPPAPSALEPDRSHLASVIEGRVHVWNLPSLREVTGYKLDGQWTPFAVLGTKVAMVRKKPDRSATTIYVTGTGGRFDLPGDVEPEAFSLDGSRLFLLDYLPDAYRVRVLDTASGQVNRLNIKDKGEVPPEGEERMSGNWKHAVYDRKHDMLYSLYLHHGEHQHTGQLLGVRPDAPDVHAFIHALHLLEGWAVCIDLPEPFGYSEPGGHTLLLGDQLYAISASGGALATIDRDDLTLTSVSQIPATPGEAFAVDGPVIVAGSSLSDTRSQWSLPGQAMGLARGKDGLLWTAVDSRLVALDFAARRQVHELHVPGLRAVVEVF